MDFYLESQLMIRIDSIQSLNYVKNHFIRHLYRLILVPVNSVPCNFVLNPICPLCTRKQHVHTNLGNASLLWSYTELRSKKDTESIHYLPIHAKPTKTVPMPVTSQTYLKFCDLSSPQLMYSLILATKTT